MELNAQQQFDLIMKQKSALLAAMAKGHGGGGGIGSVGGDGNRHRNHGAKDMCPNRNKFVIHAVANCFMLPANKDKIPTWYKPPKLD
jgi:hypothetical protein